MEARLPPAEAPGSQRATHSPAGSPPARSASSQTRWRTPIVILRPQTGQRPSISPVSAGWHTRSSGGRQKMILPLFRKKFQRAPESPFPAFFEWHGEWRDMPVHVDNKFASRPSFAGEWASIGNQREAVQPAHPPVHGRIRRKPGFHRMDSPSVTIAFLQESKPGKRPKKRGKMRRPDMCRDIFSPRTAFQQDLQDLMDGPARIGSPIEWILPMASSFGESSSAASSLAAESGYAPSAHRSLFFIDRADFPQ